MPVTHNSPAAPTSHSGDCAIFRALINGRPYDGICTCGYGLAYLREHGGDDRHLLSDERRRVNQPNVQWWIRHPGGKVEKIICATFEEAMEKWFEGFNIPVLVVDGVPEDFKVSLARVQQHYASY